MKQVKYITFFLGLLWSVQDVIAANSNDQFLAVGLEKAFNTNHLERDSLLNLKLKNLENLADQDKFLILFNKLTFDYVCGRKEFDTLLITNQIQDKEIQTLLLTTYKLNLSLSITKKEQNLLKNIDRRENLSFYLLAQFNLGRTYAKRNELNKAITFLEHAASGSLRTTKKTIESRSLYELSKLYYAQGLLERSYSFSQKALRKARLNNENTWECIYLNKLGEIQLEIGNYSAAKDFFKDAYARSTELNFQRIKGISLSNLGEIHNQKSQYKKAINSLQNALGILYNLNDDPEVAKAHLRLGTSYLTINEYALARDNYKLGLKIVSESNDELAMATFHHLLGKLYSTSGMYEKAGYHINQAVVLRKKHKAFLQLSNTYTIAAELHAKTNQFEKAFVYLQKHKHLTDSLQATETQRKIAELNSLFQTEHKELLILEQQKELEEKTNEQLLKDQELENIDLRNSQLYFLIVAIVLFFIIVFIYVSFTNKQQKLQQEHKALELQQTIFRSQMNPHFVFNAMSVIQGYIYDNDIDKSSKLLVNFSRLMRLILENSSKEFIPLNLELEILERYLKVQKIRFEDRFNFEISTENIENIEGIGIPPMLMQPFIENAIEHGNLDQIDKGLIIIKVALEPELIVLTIQDNGIGINKAKQRKKETQHKSMSMNITQERIKLLNKEYEAEGYMHIQDLSEKGESGTVVLIKTVYKSNFLEE